MGWPKGKPRPKKLRGETVTSTETDATNEFKLTAPPGKKEKKPKAKSWSGMWVETETTKIDRANGGRTCVVSVKANQTDEIAKLREIFDRYAEVEIVTMDSGKKAFGSICGESTTANPKKPASAVMTLKAEGSGTFADFVGRNVTVKGRQEKLPVGEEQGEPR